jgi:hypothetical protein
MMQILVHNYSTMQVISEENAGEEGLPAPEAETPPHLPVLYQDEALVAIHKPSGLLVHRTGLDAGERWFAVQLLRDQLGGRHVYPVHRLDKGTSGVLVFALSSSDAAAVAAHPDCALTPLKDGTGLFAFHGDGLLFFFALISVSREQMLSERCHFCFCCWDFHFPENKC